MCRKTSLDFCSSENSILSFFSLILNTFFYMYNFVSKDNQKSDLLTFLHYPVYINRKSTIKAIKQTLLLIFFIFE